jgi:hypothetical protein
LALTCADDHPARNATKPLVLAIEGATIFSMLLLSARAPYRPAFPALVAGGAAPIAVRTQVGAEAPGAPTTPTGSVGLFDYVQAHPWWTLVFLIVIGSAVSGISLVHVTSITLPPA